MALADQHHRTEHRLRSQSREEEDELNCDSQIPIRLGFGLGLRIRMRDVKKKFGNFKALAPLRWATNFFPQTD